SLQGYLHPTPPPSLPSRHLGGHIVTYQEALDYIASLEPRGWRLGLDRIREFAHRAGLDDSLGRSQDNEQSPLYIHVAGTNGKGSTTAYIQSILHESGYRVGSFFSPYVYD